ncbi:uroporphyrinogen-III synthase [Actinocrispum wychmicini]|uniref:uroporphyrinogen-III synthase n=1 Tax=Actinocrispum wychmicini TaxID=1213861 RepID=UPI001048DEA5|nr:uroporphyrinogen-III synthase [Actinocrispum wychmicini]
MLDVEVPPLAGFTVGVTAARRADELTALLERRGATVVHGPAIRIVPVPDDAELQAATSSLIAHPVDYVVVTTGIGFRGWVEAAEGWGLGPDLLGVVGKASVFARGPKAKGAVRAAGLVESWSPESESNSEMLRQLLQIGVSGRRVAVQLHGEPLPGFVSALRQAGADVVELPVYRWTAPIDEGPLERLIESVLAGSVDALTFTSAPAVASVLATARRLGRYDALVSVLRGRVVAVCVGSITAGPLVAAGVPVVRPERARIGALARTVAVELPARATRLSVGTCRLEVRGQGVVVDGVLRGVSPAPMAVLRALTATPGKVLSRPALIGVLRRHSGRDENVDAHAVETAIARLRSALGDSSLVQTVVKRGYRLAIPA